MNHKSQESIARVKKRRRAETRLKFYGITAISLAGLALIILMSTLVGKASKAFTETYISLPIFLDEKKLDPDGERDLKTLRKADYKGVIKFGLRRTFPEITSRSEKKKLYQLLSSGASLALAKQVMNDPFIIGDTVEENLLASDIVDLYMKGEYGGLIEVGETGQIKISSVGKKYILEIEGGNFTRTLGLVRSPLLEKAAFIRRQAGYQKNGSDEYLVRSKNAISEEAKTEQLKRSEKALSKYDNMMVQADELEARYYSTDGVEKLKTDQKTVLIKSTEGWLKLSEIGKTSAVATGMLKFESNDGTLNGWKMLMTERPEKSRKISDIQIVMVEQLKSLGKINSKFNTRFFTAGDSREPELAGIWGAVVGSFWTMLVTFSLSFPIGIMAAVYLEEFASKNKFTNFIEVNINNLAAVPSIIFGLLGLSVIIGFFGVPRSAPLAGGMVLALMTLPTIIIASRAAIGAVPPSIREAAYGVGASQLQTVFHHVVPLAMPGILTGTIIGMARALGETAPLIMIGMVAFIVDIPHGITDSATVLPVQVYRWSDFPERAFEIRTAAAICTLLAFLVVMNGLAVFLRKRFERRW